MTSAFNDLWSHPIGCAAESLLVSLVCLDDLFRASEICKLAHPVISQQYIRSLDVSMHDIVIMQVLKSKQYLSSILRDQVLIEVELFIVLLE